MHSSEPFSREERLHPTRQEAEVRAEHFGAVPAYWGCTRGKRGLFGAARRMPPSIEESVALSPADFRLASAFGRDRPLLRTLLEDRRAAEDGLLPEAAGLPGTSPMEPSGLLLRIGLGAH